MSIPDTIGRFRIERQIGRGTTGIVYLAWDPSLNRRIAIKLLAPVMEPTGEARKLASFERELRAAGSFSHPNIIAVHDVGHHDDRPFIAMEYIEGESLAEIVRTGSDLPPAKIADIGRQIAAALDHAHAKSVIHRDVKLSNILLGADGLAKLTDFGVAKLPYSDETMAGTAMGTPSYMAPETLVGRNVSGASDQFSLAVVLFELLTGDRPFAGPTSQAVMYRIVNEQPTSATSVAPELPEAVDAIFARALDKDPEKRYPSCTEMADTLGVALGVPVGDKQLRPEVAARIQKRFTPPPRVRVATSKGPVPSGSVGFGKWLLGMAVVTAVVVAVALVVWLGSGRKANPPRQGGQPGPMASAERRTPDSSAAPAQDGTVPEETAVSAESQEEVEIASEEAETGGSAGEPVEEAPRESVESGEEAAIGEARTLRIVTDPPGATAWSNASLLDGVTPLETVLEPATEYIFRVELEGYRAAGVAVTLEDLTEEQAASGVLFFPLGAEEAAVPPTTEETAETAVPEATEEPVEMLPGTASLGIRLISEVRRGVLMVYRGEEQLVRESFRFEEAGGEAGEATGPGVVQLRREVASGPAELRVYVMLRDRPASLVSVTTEIEAGTRPVLMVYVNPDGLPRLELR